MNKIKITKRTHKTNSKIRIIKFQPKYAEGVADVIRETYKKFCACDANEGFNKMSASFYDYKKNKEELLKCLMSREINLVVLDGDEVVGAAEGFKDSMNNFFIDKSFHRKGIGKILLEAYEKKAKNLGTNILRIYSSSNAVIFYDKMGYKKTTGVRNYNGLGIFLQLMKKN